MHAIKLVAAFMLAAALPANEAHAQRSWYAGLDAGNSKADAQSTEFLFGAPATDSADSDVGIRLRFGYQFSPYVAAELGYVDQGEFDFDFDPAFCPIDVPEPCPFSARTSLSGIVTNVVGTLPLGSRWSLNGRVGAFRMHVKIRGTGTDGRGDSGKHGGLQYGLGIGYRLNDRWALALDWTKYEEIELGLTLGGGIGAFSFGESELASLGVNYHW
jgi:large repetitive protein